MTKITSLAALTAPADDDVLPIVDVSDTSMAPSGTTKKITRANVFATPWSRAGADVLTANAMGALVVDTTKVLNTKTISVDSTLTLSGAPAANNTRFTLSITNSDSSSHVITLPAGTWTSLEAGRNVTTVVVGAGQTVILDILFVSGSTYLILSGYPTGGLIVLGSDIIIDAGANVLADVTGLIFPVEIGTYKWWMELGIDTTATTTGFRLFLNTAATSLIRSQFYNSTSIIGGTIVAGNQQDNATPATTFTAALSPGQAILAHGFATFTAAGNVQVQLASELAIGAGSAVTVRAGSSIEYRRLS